MYSKTKIVICIDDLAVGGTQQQLVRQLGHFDKERFSFFVIAMCPCDTKIIYELLPDDVIVHTLAFSSIFNIGEWFKMLRLIKSIAPNLVMSSLFLSNTTVRILYPLHRIPVISREHNVYLHKRRWQIVLDRLLVPFTKTIVAVSDEVADFTSVQESIPRKHFTVINNGIDIQAVDIQAQASTPVEVKQALGLAVDEKVALSLGA